MCKLTVTLLCLLGVTPGHTLGSMLKLKANLTAGADYVEDMQGKKGGGDYVITANAERYSSDALRLIHATSKQMAQALRAAQ